MLYVIQHEKNGDIFCDGYYWFKEFAVDAAKFDRAQMSESDRKRTKTAVLGYEITTSCPNAKKAYEAMVDADLEEQGFLRDADYYEEIE